MARPEKERRIPHSGDDDTFPRTPLRAFPCPWLFAGHASQVKEHGEFVTFQLEDDLQHGGDPRPIAGA